MINACIRQSLNARQKHLAWQTFLNYTYKYEDRNVAELKQLLNLPEDSSGLKFRHVMTISEYTGIPVTQMETNLGKRLHAMTFLLAADEHHRSESNRIADALHKRTDFNVCELAKLQKILPMEILSEKDLLDLTLPILEKCSGLMLMSEDAEEACTCPDSFFGILLSTAKFHCKQVISVHLNEDGQPVLLEL